MKKLDPVVADEISPVEFAMRVLETLVAASKAQQAQIVITLKQNFKAYSGKTGTGCRIDFGRSDTYLIEEFCQWYEEGLDSTSNVFQSLFAHLVEREEARVEREEARRRNRPEYSIGPNPVTGQEMFPKLRKLDDDE